VRATIGGRCERVEQRSEELTRVSPFCPFATSRNTLEFEFEEWVRRCGKEGGYLFVRLILLLSPVRDERLTSLVDSLLSQTSTPPDTPASLHSKAGDA
jgi:hypothetical protein